ncbi:MAG: beta-lactamase family protein [Clostridia bacterium]|nr:beta-lactamase family protein [Clostridia bacterium]
MIKLEKDAFRPKVKACIDGYLGISDKYSLTVGLYRKGEVYLFGNHSPDQPLQYDIGSISKTVTAHLILHLQEKGLLDIEKRVSDYIDLPNGDYPTLYRLLTHTSGYKNLTPVEIILPALIKHGYARRNVYDGCTTESVISCLGRRRKPMKAAYGYSDFAYAILAVVAERAAGRPIAEMIEEFVHESLGMKNTTVLCNPEQRNPPAVRKNRIYDYWKWNKDNPYIAGGGLVSNIEDMMHYLTLQLTSRENYITKAHRRCEESVSPHSNTATCIGWHTYKKSNRHWHVGGAGTFRSSVIFDKKRQIAVCVMGNAMGIGSANVHYLAKMLYGEMKTNKIKF